ncbi:MAG: PAS domain-containing protein [Cyanothece sp. SIO2G6]|nr:PAS domain-containing protein [Cyanothece sp. SIO2G6]
MKALYLPFAMYDAANDPSVNPTDFSAVLGQMPGVIYRLFQAAPKDAVRLTVVSDNCSLIFGVERAVLETSKPPLLNYIHPADQGRLATALSASAHTLGCCLWTGRMVQPSGSIRWVHLTAQPSPVSDQGIQWQGLLALSLPPEEPHQAVMELQTAPSKESSPTPPVPTTLPSRMSDTARSTLKMLEPNWHYSEERLALKHTVEERTAQLQQTVELLLDEVVERTQAERDLRDREAFLHSIYNNVSQAIFVVDVDATGEFRYADLNAACEHMFATTSDRAKGKTPEEVLGDRIGHLLRQQYQHCSAQQVSVVFEEVVPLARGEQWWRTQLTPLQHPDGGTYRIIGNATDITHQKQIEKNLKRRDRLLQGVAIAIQHLITHPHLYQSIPMVLSTLGTAIGFDHIYILEVGEWLNASEIVDADPEVNSEPVKCPPLKLAYEWGQGGTCILAPQSKVDGPWVNKQQTKAPAAFPPI